MKWYLFEYGTQSLLLPFVWESEEEAHFATQSVMLKSWNMYLVSNIKLSLSPQKVQKRKYHNALQAIELLHSDFCLTAHKILKFWWHTISLARHIMLLVGNSQPTLALQIDFPSDFHGTPRTICSTPVWQDTVVKNVWSSSPIQNGNHYSLWWGSSCEGLL